jgi:hypothetical protein
MLLNSPHLFVWNLTFRSRLTICASCSKALRVLLACVLMAQSCEPSAWESRDELRCQLPEKVSWSAVLKTAGQIACQQQPSWRHGREAS